MHMIRRPFHADRSTWAAVRFLSPLDADRAWAAKALTFPRAVSTMVDGARIILTGPDRLVRFAVALLQ